LYREGRTGGKGLSPELWGVNEGVHFARGRYFETWSAGVLNGRGNSRD